MNHKKSEFQIIENIKNIMSSEDNTTCVPEQTDNKTNSVIIIKTEEPDSETEEEFINIDEMPINPLSSSSSSSKPSSSSSSSNAKNATNIIDNYDPYMSPPPTPVYQSNDKFAINLFPDNSDKKINLQHQKLAEQFVPLFVFNKAETEYPFEITNKTLKDSVLFGNSKDEEPIREGPTVEYITDKNNPKIDKNSALLWLDESLNQPFDPSKVAVYYCYTPPTASRYKLTLLQYILKYRANDAYKCCGCCCCDLGYHQFDSEHVSIYLDENDTKKGPIIHSMYFSAHSHEQGQWKSRTEIEYMDEKQQRPVVYVAKGSHAMYPNGGTQWRIFGVANDKCADDVNAKNALVWDVRKDRLIEIDEQTPWMKYPGYMGYPDNCRTDVNMSWFRHENGIELKPYKRFFACFQKYWCCGPDLPYREPL